LALDEGWRAALDSVYGEHSPMVCYVTEAARASFIDLLPLTEQSEVFEIGPGLGQFTALLARRAKSVHALEVVAGQAEFAAERCKQSGVINVHFAVGGDDCRLPYADGVFDVVVGNLVFEWCASRCLDEAEEVVQNRLLAEMHRVLKRGGSVYLATKNRFALRHLIGKPDEHCHEMRFGSALPRWIAQYLLRLKGHRRPLGRLYSHNALKGMLRRVGFDKIDSFWAVPEMRMPTHYVPIDAASVRKARRRDGFIQAELRSARFLMPMIPAGLVKHFTPGLAFLATKR
jgi:SAM-dependent methyltransferase